MFSKKLSSPEQEEMSHFIPARETGQLFQRERQRVRIGSHHNRDDQEHKNHCRHQEPSLHKNRDALRRLDLDLILLDLFLQALLPRFPGFVKDRDERDQDNRNDHKLEVLLYERQGAEVIAREG